VKLQLSRPLGKPAGKDDECFNCGENGHFARDCKKPKRNDRRRKSVQVRAAFTAVPEEDEGREADDECSGDEQLESEEGQSEGTESLDSEYETLSVYEEAWYESEGSQLEEDMRLFWEYQGESIRGTVVEEPVPITAET
jgi:predicted  nucleic acid-binding Zn-ribbon protein